MKKIISLIVSLLLVGGIITLFWNQSTTQGTLQVPRDTSISTPINTTPSSNVTIKDGVQYITIDVKQGYSPRITEAKGGTPTKLVAKTNETYDCSSALVIHSIGYQSYLPATGETTIDLGTPKSGGQLDGTCGMGMYSFQINFH